MNACFTECVLGGRVWVGGWVGRYEGKVVLEWDGV